MGRAVALRAGITPQQVLNEARGLKDLRQVRRLLAIAAVAEGKSRAEAAEIGGMDRQTLRDWVHRYNDLGPQGLIGKPSPGRKPKLSNEQKQELSSIIDDGPDMEKDSVVRWRCVDLQRVVKERFNIDYHKNSFGRILKKLKFSHMSTRPLHPKQAPGAVEDFKKNSARR
jgi:transposase